MRAALLLAALLLAPLGTAAQEVCPGLPSRIPSPAEALPAALLEVHWRGRVAELDRRLGDADFARARLLFLGDSLTHYWQPQLFEQFYGHRQPLNLGVGGDFTQGLLWRLARLPLGTLLRPRLAVVLIGTNNSAAGSTPADTALGIAEVVRHIRRRSPETRVLLLGLLPRGPDATDAARRSNERVNALVARCADGQAVFFANPGAMLVDAEGRLSEQVAPDRLHLSWVGYGILAAALEPDIRRLLNE